MTLNERIIVSAYTGVLMCDFRHVHKYIEEKLGRPVWTHEMAIDAVQQEIKRALKPDFLELCGNENDDKISGWIINDYTPCIDEPAPRKCVQKREIMYKCQKCGREVKEKTTYCPHCGTMNIKDET